MKRRHVAIGVAAIIGGVLGLCFLVRHDGANVPPISDEVRLPTDHPRSLPSSQPLQPLSRSEIASGPAPDATLGARLPRLEAAADNGDPRAATEVFRDTARCVHVQAAQSLLPETEKLIAEGTSNLRPDEWDERQRLLSVGQHDLEKITRYSKDCEGFEINAMESGFMYRVTLRAANLGDLDAADCYVAGDFQPTEFLGNEDAREEYRTHLLRFAGDGVKRGNPLSAYLLMVFYGAGGIGPLQRAGSRDMLKAYLYARLLLYIVEGESAQEQMTGMTEAYRTEAAGLDIGGADAEAKRLFQRYYGHPIDFDVNPRSPCG